MDRFFLLMLASAGASASIPDDPGAPGGQQVTLDEAALSALPQTEFTTTTPDPGRPPLSRADPIPCWRRKDPGCSKIAVSALNGYQQVVDLALFDGVPLTLVRQEDGKPLTRRNKGPLWLLIPFTTYPKLDVPAIHTAWCGR